MSTKEKEEMSYTNKDGDNVFTSAYLKKRGTCCKTNCLHCPYGFTLKNYVIETMPIEIKDIQFANEIVTDSVPVQLSALSMSLLESAFGKKDKMRTQAVTLDNMNDFAFGKFKDTICAVIEYSTRLSESRAGRPIQKIYLKKEFQDQGLGVEHVSN